MLNFNRSLSVFFLAFLILTITAYSQVHYYTNLILSGAQENPPNNSAGIGIFNGWYDESSMMLGFSVTFEGLSGTTTAAHFHGPALPDSNTGVQIGWAGFPTTVTSGSFSDTVTLTETQETQLLSGLWYANIHSSAFGGGEIRTQLYETNPIHSFTNLLMSGSQEVPANNSAGTGILNAVYNQVTNEMIFSVEFSGLTGTTSAAHFHGPAPADSNTGVQIGWSGFPTGVTSGTFSDTVTLTETQEEQLLSGRWYANIHTSAFGGGEIRSQLYENPMVDGNLSNSQYITIAEKQNANSSFGSAINLNKIAYYADVHSSTLYVGIEGKLDVGGNNGIGFWFGFDELSGSAAGSSLGGSPGGHYMGGNGGANPNFTADFEVDYMFAVNPGSSSANLYLDAVSLVGGRTAQYLGQTDQSGTSAASINSEVFSAGSVWFAFNNDAGLNHGFEIAIPFSELGVTPSGELTAFAFVVSNSGFFSNVTVPGDVSGDSPGFDTDFNTLAGGPYNSAGNPLPVELTSFTASVNGKAVLLNWITATELNNSGFEIQRSADIKNWNAIAFVKGRGTTTEQQNYSFVDNTISSGNYFYRLRQIDFDGSYEVSSLVEIFIGLPNGFVLDQNYPNPFNPTTKIKFGFDKNTKANLKVFDVLGNEVITLFAETAEAGRIYEVDFNAAGLSSGVYYYRLSGNDRTEIKKMMLLK